MQREYVKPSEDSRFRILTEIGQQITSILEINELLHKVARIIRQTFGYYHVGIGLLENDEVVYRVGAGDLWDDPNFQFRPRRLKVGMQGITGWVAQTGKPALIADVTNDPHYVWMQGSLTRSELTVPITVKGRILGVLDVQSQHPDNFEPSDVELMQAIASQTGVAMENARLFAESQRLLKETEQRAHELEIINSVQQGLASKLDIQSIYNLVGDTFHKFFNAQVVMISTYDPQSNSIEHRYAIERGQRVHSPGRQPPGGFRSRIIQTRKPLLVNTGVAYTATLLGQPTLPGTATPKSWLGVPMLGDGQVTGILSVQNVDEENAFDEADVRLLQTFAAAMGIALENARLYEKERQVAVLEERQRLGRELHDSVTQSLYGISLYAQAATGKLAADDHERARQYLEDIQNTAQESLADMRLLIFELRPPILDREGLVVALENRLSAVENRAMIKSSIRSNLSERLPRGVEEGLYQIAREALNNVVKHAHARNVQIELEQRPTSVTLEIQDDGIGFDPEVASHKGCLGLANMQERAQAHGWQMSVKSNPGKGTRIKVEVRT
jgi:signal transduction histidine kinase